ncbi:hypothetical protein WN51_03613 [Melipona quadrifasciata]|uniref:Uncharacterized protein n=1 Tax=Melipona quadrifasciata TaxID=166423 RepID=A0A0N0BE35_9HYME|nr:hypothetical protein WN51_03613 [Melipona quadrifasciata]
MCCVLQGAERVFPSNGGKHGAGTGGNRGVGTSVGTQDLPLESLWAAGLDEGMGFPQRCSYANHHSTLANTAISHASTNPEDLWKERNLSYRTPTTSTGIDSSITDEIWTSANEAKFFRTSTTSTGIGSSLNLHENNRSLESRDGDFYSTDIEDSKDTYRRVFPNTPTTSGLGSSSDRQSVETQRGSKDLPDHLWAAAMEDGFSRFNAMKSLQTITRQPRPNHDWVKTERISRFTKHRTISQSPQREEEIWTSKLNENNVSGYATDRINGPHKCHHQTRRSFSTSVVADLAVTPDGSQQSLGSGEFLATNPYFYSACICTLDVYGVMTCFQLSSTPTPTLRARWNWFGEKKGCIRNLSWGKIAFVEPDGPASEIITPTAETKPSIIFSRLEGFFTAHLHKYEVKEWRLEPFTEGTDKFHRDTYWLRLSLGWVANPLRTYKYIRKNILCQRMPSDIINDTRNDKEEDARNEIASDFPPGSCCSSVRRRFISRTARTCQFTRA